MIGMSNAEEPVPEDSKRADTGWDNYANRVLRNEARLGGLEALVKETRESDRRLVEQRSDSLADELERRAVAFKELVTARADAVVLLGREERESDRREVEILYQEAEKRAVVSLASLREVHATSMQKNYEQSREAISALEERDLARSNRVEQMVRQWRDSDREARDLFAGELARHLDVLNHNNERMSLFQASSVTRELWQSEKDASIIREGLLRDQIIVLDRVMLTMTPIQQSDKTHAEMMTRIEATISASAKVLEAKIGVNEEKITELKEYQATTQGKSQGYSSLYAWAATAFTIIVAVIVIANALFGR